MCEEETKKKIERKYDCPSCSFSTHWPTALLRHKRRHTNSMITCELCTSQFPDRSLYRSHMKVKHGDGLICSHCGKRYHSRSGLRYHMRKVRGEFRHGCQLCGKTYDLKNELEQHMNVHRKVKPHLCSSCGKSFYYKSYFNAHRKSCGTKEKKSEGKVQEFICLECNIVFVSQESLRNHNEGKHKDKIYTCKVCNKEYCWRASYYRHIKSHE